MITFTIKKDSILKYVLAIILGAVCSFVKAQTVLFNFDDIPVYTPFPVTHTVSGITAHFSGTGSSYSIQAANVMGFTPAGFSGNIVYPSSVYQADLLISFDQKISDFSIMYSVQELACDTSATMQVRGYMKGVPVVTTYTIASVPGTWPVDTLKCSFATGMDSVVVHFYSHPSRCMDWGPIFLADNMKVTPAPNGVMNPKTYMERLIVPNPISQSSTISFSLTQPEEIKIVAYDITGRLVKNIYEGFMTTGDHKVNLNDNSFTNGGIYLLNITEMNFTRTYKVIVVK